MILCSQLYGRADVCGDAISESVVCPKEGVDAIVDAAYMMDTFFCW